MTTDATVLSLVDHDELGNPVRLLPRLGNLPLQPDKDGWYSVLGSWNGTATGPNPANLASEGNSETNPTIPVLALGPRVNPRPSPPTIFCKYHKCSGNSGPHTCAPGRYTCEASNCSWPGSFKTKQAFNRRYKAMHDNDRVDCPVERCLHIGAQGIKRADNLDTHMWNKYGISQPRMVYGN